MQFDLRACPPPQGMISPWAMARASGRAPVAEPAATQAVLPGSADGFSPSLPLDLPQDILPARGLEAPARPQPSGAARWRPLLAAGLVGLALSATLCPSLAAAQTARTEPAVMAVTASPSPSAAAPRATVAAAASHAHPSVASGYIPKHVGVEGGPRDRIGKPLHTLQSFLAGKAPYVSVAMDRKLEIPYGTRLRIPELESTYGRPIEFRVVDTGGAFTDKGYSRIDICTASHRHSLDDAVNRPLTLVFE